MVQTPNNEEYYVINFEMLSTKHDIIVMLISIIATNMDSLSAFNLLIRTSKSLQFAGSSDERLIASIVSNMPASTKMVLCKLFVLPAKVSLPFSMVPCLPRYNVADAFRRAMEIHGGVGGITVAFNGRMNRSRAMKKVWKDRKEEMRLRLMARRLDVEQIHQDLFIIPSRTHTTTDAELNYIAHGVIKRLGVVYRGKRLMRLHNAGLLHGLDNNFLRIVRIEMTAPETLTNDEKLLVLRHNIAWEHYLTNYTNLNVMIESMEHHVFVDIEHLESLIPLPYKWPWRSPPKKQSTVVSVYENELRTTWNNWCETHEFLYDIQ
jgi:hypothetical protein